MTYLEPIRKPALPAKASEKGVMHEDKDDLLAHVNGIAAAALSRRLPAAG